MTGTGAQFSQYRYLTNFLILLIFLHNSQSELITITRMVSITDDFDERILVNDTTKYVYNYTFPAASSRSGPARISVEALEEVNPENPVVVVVWYKKGVMSWQIPYDVGNYNYTKISRTLCPDKKFNQTDLAKKVNHHISSDEDVVFVSLTTVGKRNVLVRLKINTKDVGSFFVGTKKLYNVPPIEGLKFTPSEPWYYQFNWPEETLSRNTSSKNRIVDSVVLKVDSLGNLNSCMTVSVQNLSCPVLDTETTVGHEGYWQTVDWKGGFTINKHDFPHGFFIVFILNGDDKKCLGSTSSISNEMYSERTKNISFSVSETISIETYSSAILIPLAVYFGVCLLFAMGAALYACRPFSKTLGSSRSESSTAQTSIEAVECEQQIQSPVRDPQPDEMGYDTTDNSVTTDGLRSKKVLYLCDLAKKDVKILRRKSDMYVFQLLTVAVFYSLPVAQLMLSYQTIFHKTGNQDTCFYNFLCAHPLTILGLTISDFNHIYSNIGYVILGWLFIFWTLRRDIMYQKAVKCDPELDKVKGIPQHFGFYYAIGWALVMEGLLSASYHICPNKTNFQFDTSFMYIMAVLCMVKLYHNRHPDINASAYTTFMTLALIIFFGMIGIIGDSEKFFIFMNVVHISMCLWLSAQVYYLGSFSADTDKSLLARIKEVQQEVVDNPRAYLTPKYPNRFVLLTIGNALNAALVTMGWRLDLKDDFGSFLLMVLLANLMLYYVFYIIMKLINGEKLLIEPLLYSIASVLLAVPSCYFFYQKVTSSHDTPAVSRRGNQPCIVRLDFYDSHDVWHFLSAGGLFCTFMVLLTLDDDLVNKKRSEILVF